MSSLGISIKTERLLLKPISLDYVNQIFTEFSREIAVFMFPQPTGNISDIFEFINGSLRKMSNKEELQQVVICAKTGEFLGCAGLHRINTSTPELGIWIKKSAHGNAYGRESIFGLKEWADKNLKYDYLLYPVACDNVPSRKIAESLGAKIEREYIGEKQNGEKMNQVEYRIYQKESV